MLVDESDAPGFSRLTIEDWRQFDSIDLFFHPRLTVLTGANASGKSTLLGLLSSHFNWTRAFSSSPIGSASGGLWSAIGRRRARKEALQGSGFVRIGDLTYGTGVKTEVLVPGGGGEARMQYSVHLPQQQHFPGLFLTSHRIVSGDYTPVATIPVLPGSADQLLEQFLAEVRNRHTGAWSNRSPQLALKESLIAAAVFGGGGNASVEVNQDARDVWTGFQTILAATLPQSLGFTGLKIRVPDVIIESSSGDFLWDEASGGVSAIIELAWQIFLRSRNQPKFTVLLDEPENHLHPSLQREIMPSLIRAFPSVQFIVATHSPFVVTATPDSSVYVLEYNKSRRVQERRLDYANKSASADETLRRVLGLGSTMPIWAERQFDVIVNKYLSGSVSSSKMAKMRAELRASGLESEFPRAVVDIVDGEAGKDQA